MGGLCWQDRRNEWESTQLIKCMLQHYCEGGQFEEELLEKCKKLIHSSALRVRLLRLLAAFLFLLLGWLLSSVLVLSVRSWLRPPVLSVRSWLRPPVLSGSFLAPLLR